ncbi:hypothetical protein LCGC14_2273940 [marine sediment metagenome]|uniref:Uncharacterized protein n=1 Tax=marine sediment metagenome TaxID=412755 RepID=A0A0F9CWA2_9ZZZZ
MRSDLDELKECIGQQIVDIKVVKDSWGEHYELILGNGLAITGIDGEFGDNALEIVREVK